MPQIIQLEPVEADWERIEVEYRAGIMSLREIGIEHGITEGAVRKRAKRDGWERDLTARIKDKAEALVRKEAVRSEVRSTQSATEQEIVESNAQAIANIRLAHRGDIRKSRSLAMSLLEELESMTANKTQFHELGEFLRQDDAAGQQMRIDLYHKIISNPSRIDSMKKLSDTLKTLIGLEREAYGLSTIEGKGHSELSEQAIDEQIARLQKLMT